MVLAGENKALPARSEFKLPFHFISSIYLFIFYLFLIYLLTDLFVLSTVRKENSWVTVPTVVCMHALLSMLDGKWLRWQEPNLCSCADEGWGESARPPDARRP